MCTDLGFMVHDFVSWILWLCIWSVFFSLFCLFLFQFVVIFKTARKRTLFRSFHSFVYFIHSSIHLRVIHLYVSVAIWHDCSKCLHFIIYYTLEIFDCSEFCVDLVIKYMSIYLLHLFIYFSFAFVVVFSLNSGEFHTGYTRNELQGVSWYHLLHWESMREAQNKHRLSECHFITRTCQIIWMNKKKPEYL